MPIDQKATDRTYTFEQQLWEEREHIKGARQAVDRQLGNEGETEDDADDLLGLAFSGGGIRSATFNLGILQGLATHGLLHEVDYLSTVSGGGYIGGWLSTWVHRSRDGEDGTSPPGILGVEAALDSARCQPDDDTASQRAEPRQVGWLRRFSNYLTPRLGIFSTDTLTGLATYLRNLLLNQLALAAFGIALLLLPWLAASLLASVGATISGFETALYGLCTLLLFAGAAMAGYETRDIMDSREGGIVRRYWGIIACFSVATLVGGALITVRAQQLPTLLPAIAGGGAYGIGWLLGWLSHRVNAADGSGRQPIHWIPPLAGLLAGVVFGALLYLWGSADPLASDDTGAPLLLTAIVVGPLATLGALLLTVTLHLGLAGRSLREAARELWSRHGADQMRIGIFWLLLTATALLGPFVVFWIKDWVATLGGVVWVVTTLAGVITGAGSATHGSSNSRWSELAARVAPYIFIVGLLLMLSYGTYRFLWWQWSEEAPHQVICPQQPPKADSPAYDLKLQVDGQAVSGQVYNARAVTGCTLQGYDTQSESLLLARHSPLLGYLLILAVVVLVMSRRIDINVFSFHAFYRNRLERCYLGASHTRGRRPHPVTGLDPRDSPRLDALTHDLGGSKPWQCVQRPFPIINTALNLTSSKNLAWQERKAASFTFTPLFCGYQLNQDDGQPPLSAFQPTAGYVASHGGWLSLGMPITISGAAASPNSGYHTSAATAFLMTLFNVRLGWWLQNPLYGETWRQAGPRYGMSLLLQELAGMTTEQSSYVYLSDGGHFENLGIYELVRRRCRYIVVCDAGCDPHYGFEDLGNAIRKCKIDHGVDIEIDTHAIKPVAAGGFSSVHCAVGRIYYGTASDRQSNGYLLYLKASLTGDEPSDVLQYRDAHPDFPHQTTADQWFSESQFESYRKLGAHILERVVGDLMETTPRQSRTDLEGLFLALAERWYPASRHVESAFSKHGEALEAIFEAVRKDPHLAFLDAQIYPEWWYLKQATPCEADAQQPTMLPSTDEEKRAGFYLCNNLIQLMENVYLDLHLEEEHDHPDNRGWMNLFRHWSRAGMFRVTWTICAGTYGARFQRFCRRHLSMQAGLLGCCDEFPADDNGKLMRLNPAERNMATQTLRSDLMHGLADPSVVRLSLKLEDLYRDGHETALEFPVGFALIATDDQGRRLLVYYRIQDHLRNMGLGHRGLAALKTEKSVQGPIPPSPAMRQDEEHRYRILHRMWEAIDRIDLADVTRRRV
ncbi:MAG: hypothetical protein P8178_11995 [Candidatus Thiodiazotropha sp.]